MKSFVNKLFVTSPSRKLFYLLTLASLLALTLVSAAGPRSNLALAYADPGTIAYVRSNDATGDEIRLVEPDGSNDRLLWKSNVPLNGVQQIYSLDWRPDAKELAFASRHEEACSYYSSDVYVIRPDGGGFRRFTAPPSCGRASGLPTGTVNVTIDNYTDSNGPFVVYFEGAPGPQTITLAPGYEEIVTFNNVADFGSFDQWAVVIFGQYRFTSVGGNADVLPGKAVNTDGPLSMDYAYTNWGWTSPTWSGDGNKISYVFNNATPYSMVGSNTAAGMIGAREFNIPIGSFASSVKFISWAPSGPRSNQLLYEAWALDYSSENVYLATGGSSSAGEIVFDVDPQQVGHTLLGLAWLPDSSGFLYSITEGWGDYANIYKYDFATKTSTRLTNYSTGYPRRLSISPDAAHVVFEYQAAGNWYDYSYDLDLWMMDRYGNAQIFIQDARAPSWSQVALPAPVVYDHSVFLPLVVKP